MTNESTGGVLDTAVYDTQFVLSKCMYTTLPDLEGNDKIEVVLVH